MVELTRAYPMPPLVHGFRYLSVVLRRTIHVCLALAAVTFVLGITINDDAFGLGGLANTALDRYLRNVLRFVGLGGVLGAALLLMVTRYAQHRLQRRALDPFADDPDNRDQPPVAWQRAALRGRRASRVMFVLGIPTTIVFAFFTLVSWPLFVEDPHIGMQIVLAGSVTLAVLGILMVWAGSRPVTGAAKRVWGGGEPSLHPLEPGRRRDAEGKLLRPSRFSLFRVEPDRTALALAPAPIRSLARLDSASNWLRIAVALPLIGVAVTTGITLALRGCDTCQDGHGPGTEAFIDGTLVLGTVFLAMGALLLVGAAVLSTVVALRLRRTILDIATDPTAAMPPWHLLRQVLLEEVPAQAALGSLHTSGTILLAVGLAGLRTGPEYPLSEWYVAFPPMVTIGGILLLFHASSWFWRRRQTLAENQALLERW